MRAAYLPIRHLDASLPRMNVWTHTLHLLWVLALLVPRVGLAMPGDVDVPPDCPGHGQVAAFMLSDLADHDQVGDVSNQRASDDACSADCLLSCGLAGLQAGLPMGASQGELLPDTHPVAQLAAREPVTPPGGLFRPPRA